MKTKVTLPKLNNQEEKVTVHKLNRNKDTVLDLIHHKDEINVPKVELNTIAVQEVVDTKNKERTERCSREILATFIVALLVFLTVAITIGFYLERNIRTCSEMSALKAYKGATFEMHAQKVTLSNNEEKYGIPECGKATIDFEKRGQPVVMDAKRTCYDAEFENQSCVDGITSRQKGGIHVEMYYKNGEIGIGITISQ